MARKLIVEVVGDSRSLERTFARSTTATKRFGRNMDTSLGRAEARLTRFQRVAAGGFIGGALAATGITALKRIIDVSSESQQVLGQTKVALEATGKSWETYGKQIEDTVQKQSRLGFDDEALLRTFSLFQRTTGDVNKALGLNNLAMDVARARFIDLEQAATLVNKAALGQAGALRRLGIDAKTGATSTELLTLLTEKYGGSAQAASKDARTAMERVSVSVENLQESMGTLLLPVVELLADDLDAAAVTAQRLVDGLNAIGSVKIPTIELPFNITIGGQSIGDLARGAAGVLKFTPLNPLFGITIAKAIADQFLGQTKAATPDLANSFARSINTMTTNALDTAAGQTKAAPVEPPAFGQPGFRPINRDKQIILGGLDTAISFFQTAINKATVTYKTALDAANKTKAAQDAAEKQRTAFQNLIDSINLGVERAAETRGFADDLRRNTQLQNAIKAQIKVEGKTTELARMLFQARQDRQRIINQMRQGAAESLQARQFGALGLTATGDQAIPGVENLRKQLSQLTSHLVNEGEMTPKIQSQLQRIGKVLAGGFGKVTEQTREKVRDMFRDIRQVFGEETNKGLGQDVRRVTLSDKILAALGFGKDPGVAGVNSLGNAVRSLTATSAVPRAMFGNAATSSGVTINGPITVVADNPDAFLRQLQKKAGRTSATARGRFPGRSLGLG